jgi:signal peptide peptidase SppA
VTVLQFKKPKPRRPKADLWADGKPVAGVYAPRTRMLYRERAKRGAFVLTNQIARAHASPLLALDGRALGRSFALNDAPPAAPIEAPNALAGNVAVVTIEGPLTQRAAMNMCGYSDGYDAIENRFTDALADESVGAVLLVIDSPGGDAAGLFEAVTRMRAAKVAAKKPVIAYADELIASAAYAIACVADEIYLPRSGEVGSVGVVAIHCDETAANAQAGLKFTLFRSGPRKAEENPLEVLTDVAASAMQGRVNELAKDFFALVAGARGMTPEAVAALGGAVLTGQEAVSRGLANGIASLDQVMAKAASARLGAPMTDEEKKKMDDLEARLAKLEAPPPPESSDGGDDDEDEEGDDAEDMEGDESSDDAEDPPPPPPKGKAKSMKTSSKLGARMSGLEKKNKELESEVEELRANELRRTLRATVGRAVAEGKIPPGKKDKWVEKAMLSRDPVKYLELELDTLPVHVAKDETKAGVVGSATALTPEEKVVAKQLGLTDEQFLKSKADDLSKKKVSA